MVLLSRRTWAGRSVSLDGERLMGAANLFLYLQAGLFQSGDTLGVFSLLADLFLRFAPGAGFFFLPGALQGIMT